MQNPFDVIFERFDKIETRFNEITSFAPAPQIEIIDRAVLCDRLGITEPTAIRWEKKGKIPCFRIGSNVRYNWSKVIQALEQQAVN